MEIRSILGANIDSDKFTVLQPGLEYEIRNDQILIKTREYSSVVVQYVGEVPE